MDSKEVAKTFREWVTEMVGYPSRFGPFPECFALVAIRSLESMKSQNQLLLTAECTSAVCVGTLLYTGEKVNGVTRVGKPRCVRRREKRKMCQMRMVKAVAQLAPQ